jgi:TPR repeat protein
MNPASKDALEYARKWVRRSPGPDSWANLAAVYATMEPSDLKRARQWYRRAARRGHHRGLFEYGLMLIQGEGGLRRPAQGRRFLERAARFGQIDALKLLAFALSRGGYSYQPSPTRAKHVNAALRRARARCRKETAGQTSD